MKFFNFLTLAAAIFFVAGVFNLLLVRWPLITAAYADIHAVYPAVIWIGWALVVLIIVGTSLYWFTHMELHAERHRVITSFETVEREKIRAELRSEMQTELRPIMETINGREESLAERERVLEREALRIQSADRQAEAKRREYETTLRHVAEKTDILNFWLGQVDCGVEIIAEDHETLRKLFEYLSQWIEKATASPADFVAEMSKKNFDVKRFHRNENKLEKIHERYLAIQNDCQQIKSQLEGRYVEPSR